jgi:small subunit ribosomal protein S20
MMATRSKSAKKRVKTSKKRKNRNILAKKEIKTAFKAAERAIATKSDEAKKLISKAISIIDKTVQKGIIHKNRASRKKSRLLSKT